MCCQWCCSWFFFHSVSERKGASSTASCQPSQAALHLCTKQARENALFHLHACLDIGAYKMHSKVKKRLSKASLLPSHPTLPFPEPVKLCFAKSVGFSRVHHSHLKTFTAVMSKNISLIPSLHFIDLLVLMPEFSTVVPFAVFLFHVCPLLLLTGLKCMDMSYNPFQDITLN